MVEPDVAVGARGRHRPVAEHTGLHIEECRGHQPILNLVARFQDNIDSIAARQKRQRREVAVDARAEVWVAQIPW